MKCPKCGSSGIVKHSFSKNGKQRYTCKQCGKRTNADKLLYESSKVLIFDIETLPIVGYTWGVWNVNISPLQIIKDWCMLSWSAKWLGSAKVYGDVLSRSDVNARDDKRICQSLWGYLDEADVVIAHNCDKFDRRKANTRFLQHQIVRPSSYQTIDTLKVLKAEFGHTFRKLDYVNKVLGLDVKLPMDFNDWILCDQADQAALDKMLEYNKEDVKILEELYILIRGWIRNHPNMGWDGNSCSICGSEQIEPDGNYYRTKVGKYPTVRCMHCGGISRSRFSALGSYEKSNLLTVSR